MFGSTSRAKFHISFAASVQLRVPTFILIVMNVKCLLRPASLKIISEKKKNTYLILVQIPMCSTDTRFCVPICGRRGRVCGQQRWMPASVRQHHGEL